MRPLTLTVSILAFASTALVAGHSSAAEPGCTLVTALPYNIQTPGRYCLGASLTTANTTSNGISISASDVVLDLQGFAIENTAPKASVMGYGVTTFGSSGTVSVRNGSIRGFREGVHVPLPIVMTVEDLAISATTVGIAVVKGAIRRNQISVGCTAVLCRGITTSTGDVRDNQIELNVTTPLPSNGILCDGACAIDHNTIRLFGFATPPAGSDGITFGALGGLARGNYVNNFANGIHAGNNKAVFVDNVVGTTTTAYVGGVRATSNVP